MHVIRHACDQTLRPGRLDGTARSGQTRSAAAALTPDNLDVVITTEHLHAAVAVLASTPTPVADSVEPGLLVAG